VKRFDDDRTLVSGLWLCDGAVAQGMPFGLEEDWTYLDESKLAGPGMIRATPYEGHYPHRIDA